MYSELIDLRQQMNGLKFKDVELAQASLPMIARFIWKRYSFKDIFSIIVRKPVFNSSKRNFNMLVTHACGSRKDHLNKITDFCQTHDIDKDNVVELSSEKIESLSDLIESLVVFSITLYLFFKSFKKMNCWVVFFSVFYSVRTIRYFESLTINTNSYIAYNSADMAEAVLCLVLNKVKIQTYGLQHGMYFRYKNRIPMDIINYCNICSKNFFVWGDYSLNEIKGDAPKGLNFIKRYDFGGDTKSEPVEDNGVLIITPRILYKKEILALLDILISVSSSIEFKFKLHPSTVNDNDINALIDVTPNFTSCVKYGVTELLCSNSYKACISFNSTTLFEAILFKQNVIHFISGNDEFFIPNVSYFRHREELIGLLDSSVNVVDSQAFFEQNTAPYDFHINK